MSSGISRMKWRGKLSLEGLSLARHEILAMPTFWSAKQHAHKRMQGCTWARAYQGLGPGIKEDK